MSEQDFAVLGGLFGVVVGAAIGAVVYHIGEWLLDKYMWGRR